MKEQQKTRTVRKTTAEVRKWARTEAGQVGEHGLFSRPETRQIVQAIPGAIGRDRLTAGY